MVQQLRNALILRRKQLEERINLSRSSIYARIDASSPQYDPTFPRPISLGGRAVGWFSHEIEAWLESQASKSRRAA